MISHSPKYLKIQNQYIAVENATRFEVTTQFREFHGPKKHVLIPVVIKYYYNERVLKWTDACYPLSDEEFDDVERCQAEAERLFRKAIEEGF